MNAIEIDHLTKAFGSFVAVSDVSMNVKRGEFMGLLGPNGAGKSTTLKVITGLITPTSGTVTINGIDCGDHSNAMDGVGCVIETPDCYPNFTPMEVLRYVGKITGVSRNDLSERIRETLEEVRMWEWRNKKIGKFSKGMRQRVSIAQALLPDPDILLFDEPTSGLDPRGMVEIREILSGLKKQGKSLLISTHILSEVSEICDAVTVIRRGKTMMSGKVRDLMMRQEGDVTIQIGVRHDITEAFMRDISKFNCVSNAECTDKYTVNITFNGDDDREGIVDVVRDHNLGLLSLNQKGSDIESLYMSLTAEDDRDDIK